MFIEIWSFCFQNILSMVFDQITMVHHICNVSLIKIVKLFFVACLNRLRVPVWHIIIYIAITSVENGCSLFDYSTKRYLIHEKHTRVRTTKFDECLSYFREEIDVLSGFNVENKNKSRKNGGHFISFYLENRPRDQILYC
jgi:hypothetical protein